MNHYKKILTSVALFLFFIAGAQRRTGDFMVYSSDNGLPAFLYYQVFQSSDGYLWMGSSSGLVRFDGKRYKTFYSGFNNPNSPSDNIIIDFVEDDKQQLWMAGLIQGLTKYDLRTGRFRKYPRLSNDKTPTYGINKLLRDKEGTLWIATGGRGLARYNAAKDTFDLYIPDPSKPADGTDRYSNHVTGISQDRLNPDILWLSCFDGLYSFNKKTKSFRKFSYNGPHNDEAYGFLCVETDSNNKIWLGTWFRGLISFDKSTEQFTFYPKGSAGKQSNHYLVMDIKQVADSSLYLASGNDGLLHFNIHTGKIRPLLTSEYLPGLSSGIGIQRISITPDAGIFIGGNHSIYQQHSTFNRLGRSVKFKDEKNQGIENVIYDASRNGYWMTVNRSPDAHVLFYDQQMELKREYTVPTGTKGPFHDIAIDKNNRVWGTSVFLGLYLLNDSKQVFSKTGISFPGSDTLQQQVRAIETDRDGNLWLQTKTKIFHLDITSNTVRSFNPGSGDTALYHTSFCAGRDNDAWLASSNGLYHFTLKDGKVFHLLPDPSKKEFLAKRYIKSMTVDRYGCAWLGFESDGVQIISPKDHSILSSHNLDDGLPNMQINYMTTDTSGRIWVATTSGLALFDPKVKVWQLYNRNDGIRRDYVDWPIIATSNGMLFITIDQGFSWFGVDRYKGESGHRPVPHLTALNVDGKPYKEILSDCLEKVELPHSVNEVMIEFAAMDWLYPSRTQYFYLVEGIHKSNGWIPNQGTPVTLTGMKHGKYMLRMYAVNGDGAISDELHLPIIIHPAFWQRWWFKVFCIAVILAMVYGLYRYRIRQLKKLQQMRNTISRNLHDDIGASLSNIHILNELTKRNIGNKDKASGYIAKAGEDIQRISESLSDIVWNINPRYDDIANLFIRMKRYAADMFDGRNIEGELIFPVNTEKMFMPMDQRRDFYLIFKEAINNLVKYSKATQAKVNVWSDDHTIHLTIEDNGLGFDPGQVNNGNGIQNMKQRADKWKAALLVNSAQGKGTTISLQMKVGRETR